MKPADEAIFPSTPGEAAKSSVLRDSVRAWLTESLDGYYPLLRE